MKYKTFDHMNCSLAQTLDIIGERWTLLILRDLVLGATRFNQFQRFIPLISPTVLNKRLSELQARGLIVRKRIPNQRGHEYQLTSMQGSRHPGK